ncbi:hypothetical protein GALMADRAFT_761165 [Galerina marginata CBS 339.88]|uniref:Uncharacterized protein n=1 Tax=Galerina marginata (strain CBS 339.88) TaxID=685588 RepID=A0A067SP12_GALM3|nr:hypothetical protein GALMADRAFT_761165 [Galerina marginata CBS 339.88]
MSTISKITNFYTVPDRSITFYAIPTTPKAEIRIILSSSMIGMVFGAIHCTGIVDAVFRSPDTLNFWLVFSVATAIIPGLIALVALLRIWNEGTDSKVFTHLAGILTVFAFLSLPFYATARVGILASGFLSLGTLPEKALYTIPWTSYFPHV